MTRERFEDRFWRRVDKTGACWIWTGSLDTGGYGNLSRAGKMVRAHRASWELKNGELPPRVGHHGVCVCHRCDVRACVNPEHLFIGSQRTNIADQIAKQRFPERVGVNNGRAKLTAPEVLAIRRDSRRNRDIADDYAVDPSTVSGIKRRVRWAHLA